MMDGRALREVVGVRVFGRIVRDDREPLDALGPDLMRDLGDVEAALGRLAAGHRDGVVVEDLVGDADAGGRCRAKGEQPGMGVGAVAEILENVLLGREGRLSYPVHALGAHMRDQIGAARRHAQSHAVATDAGHGSASLGHARGGVVRATRAEERRARELDLPGGRNRSVEGLEPGEALLQHWAVVAELAQPRHQCGCNDGRRQLALARQ